MNPDSFDAWLADKISEALRPSAGGRPPLVVWCDPAGEWLDTLHRVSKAAGFELWAPDSVDKAEHELLLRERFCREPPRPRIVWLPRLRHAPGFFKVFEMEAQHVWEKSLAEAVREYGIRVPRDQEQKWQADLPHLVRELGPQARSAWSSGGDGRLMDDRRVLRALAGPTGEFERLRAEGLFDIFSRRAKEDFGLPAAEDQEEHIWRVEAAARLLATDAAEAHPQEPPREPDRIITPGAARRRALDLLDSWRNDVRLVSSFERTMKEADKLLRLATWARNLAAPPASTSSRDVERTWFDLIADRLEKMEDPEALVRELVRDRSLYLQRSEGFWARLAEDNIGWPALAQLAQSAGQLMSDGSDAWSSVADAVTWYSQEGWRIDWAGEQLFVESVDFPSQLVRLRARLRRIYLRLNDRVGRAFSERLAREPQAAWNLPTAGEAALDEMEKSKSPTAVLFLDACRMDLGCRLAEMLNAGEPAPRAAVLVAAAPLPSVTAVGMPLALPVRRDELQVSVNARGGLAVRAKEFDGDLSLAAERRRWLEQRFGVKDADSWQVNDLLDDQSPAAPSRGRKMIAAYGDDFDQHDGDLLLTGCETQLRRYERVVRKLRDAGWRRVIVVTDHGFYHGEGDDQLVEQEKPRGKILWQHRRAMVGHGLTHPHAIVLRTTCSDLEVCVPRSVSVFQTHGGTEFLHGGATLQEMIVPVVVIAWPAQLHKAEIVLERVEHIASLTPWVKLRVPGLFGTTDTKVLSRSVRVWIKDEVTGKTVFQHSEPVVVPSTGEELSLRLELLEHHANLSAGSPLVVEVRDADDDEVLARESVRLEIDIDEW